MTSLCTSSYWLIANPATKPTKTSSRTRRIIRRLWLLMVHYALANGEQRTIAAEVGFYPTPLRHQLT
jgi:hypothetical protein